MNPTRMAGVAGLLTLLCACAAPRHEFYAAHAAHRQAVAEQNAARLAAVQASAAACSDDTCRVAVAGFAALVQSERIAAPVQYRSQAASVLGLVERAVSVGAAVYGQKIQGESLVDLAGVIAGSAGDRSTHSWSYVDQSDNSDNSDNSSHTSIADSYNSHDGDTISDSGNTSVVVSGDGSSAGDENELVNGHNANNSGEIRIDSPGPIDSSNPGNDCDNDSCNPDNSEGRP